MKVLWFTNTPSLYEHGTHPYNGCGWIESLEALIRIENDIELAVSFPHKTAHGKTEIDGRLYYPMLRQSVKSNPVRWLINNHFCVLENESTHVKQMLDVINEFKPDIIQVFGTEGYFCLLQGYTQIPIVIHLQGMLNPIWAAFFPPGMNMHRFSKNTNIKDAILGETFGKRLIKFKKMASREKIFLKKSKHIIGRTKWDKQVSLLLAPQASYYHVDEILRQVFYEKKKEIYKIEKSVNIISIISSTTYKGIDVILKTAEFLSNNIDINFTWIIAGIDETNYMLRLFEKELNIRHIQNNIKFIGRQSSDYLVKLLIESDIYVHPSYLDNSPNSVCEAQILGLPVIACNVGGVSSIIQNEKNGILIPSNGIYELAFTIQDYTRTPEKYFAMGRNARIDALLRHDRKEIVRSLKDSYSKILNAECQIN